jgi:hypothetical protein
MLSERYFQGVNPLMPEAEERLADVVVEGERLADRFNDALEMENAIREGTRKRHYRSRSGSAPIREAAQANAESHGSMLVDMARAEAHEMMGERKQALSFAERHL